MRARQALVTGVVSLLVWAPSIAAAAQQPAQTPVRPGNGVTSPRLIKQVEPSYPASAVGSTIQGTVTLEAVVGVDGTPTAARVTRPLSPAFDAAAIEAVKLWRFEPGRDATGTPVPVIVMFVLEFKAGPPATADEDPELAAAFRPGIGISNPTLIRQAEPKFTADAMRAGIEGVVELDAVVRTDGTVGAVKIVKSLDRQFGLDGEAIKAAKLWLFKPGADQNGTPVPVRVRLILEFRP